MRRFHEVNGFLIDHCSTNDAQMLLISAYFSEEYAFEAAALFNPSIVAHPINRASRIALCVSCCRSVALVRATCRR